MTVPALPETLPVTVLEKVLVPEKVLLSARSVELAAPASEVRYPELFVHCEMLGEAKLDTVSPRDDVATVEMAFTERVSG